MTSTNFKPNTTGNLQNNTTGPSFGFKPDSMFSADNLKGKLQGLEQKILEAAAEINENKKKVINNGNAKDEIQDYLKQKNKDVHSKLSEEIDKVEEDMNNHFTKQKTENAKLQDDIAKLKDQKRQLQDLLMALQRKITDLEVQAGISQGIPGYTV